jgi:hypothetical protein
VRRREPEKSFENWINDARRRLADWRGKKPETKAGQIWALWPEIKAALADGQSVKSIRVWLEEEAGVVVTADSLRSYVRRCREKEQAQPTNASRYSDGTNGANQAESRPHSRRPLAYRVPSETVCPGETTNDPMEVARQALNKSRFDIRKVHGDGDPGDHNLI